MRWIINLHCFFFDGKDFNILLFWGLGSFSFFRFGQRRWKEASRYWNLCLINFVLKFIVLTAFIKYFWIQLWFKLLFSQVLSLFLRILFLRRLANLCRLILLFLARSIFIYWIVFLFFVSTCSSTIIGTLNNARLKWAFRWVVQLYRARWWEQ